jgi:hypothetical protein
MTYAVGGSIQASDYNGFISSINTAWSTGAGDAGYGQPLFPSVSVGSIIYARPATVVASGSPGVVAPTWSTTPEWRTLINTINDMSNHQTGSASIVAADFTQSASLPVSASSTSGLIAYGTSVSSSITTVTGTQRLNATAQGATSSTTITNNTTWNDTLTFAWTITFSNHDACRHYFNCGGQISISCAHPAGAIPIDQLISDMCSDAGTIWLSSTNGTPATVSLAGTSYNGVTKVGGANPGGLTINQNNGFYALGAVDSTLIEQKSDFIYGTFNNSILKISAAYNGSGVLTITALLDEVNTLAPIYGGLTVSIGSTSTLTLRPPSTTYVSNTWGTPTITSVITPVTQP